MNPSNRQASADGSAARRMEEVDKEWILTIQPEPIDADVMYIPMGRGRTASVIRKFWADGEGERCSRCNGCTLRDNVCLIGADWKVPTSEARYFWGKRYKSLDGPPSGSLVDRK